MYVCIYSHLQVQVWLEGIGDSPFSAINMLITARQCSKTHVEHERVNNNRWMNRWGGHGGCVKPHPLLVSLQGYSHLQVRALAGATCTTIYLHGNITFWTHEVLIDHEGASTTRIWTPPPQHYLGCLHQDDSIRISTDSDALPPQWTQALAKMR